MLRYENLTFSDGIIQRFVWFYKVKYAEVDEEDTKDGSNEENEGLDQEEVLDAIVEFDEAVSCLEGVLKGEDVEERWGS